MARLVPSSRGTCLYEHVHIRWRAPQASTFPITTIVHCTSLQRDSRLPVASALLQQLRLEHSSADAESSLAQVHVPLMAPAGVNLYLAIIFHPKLHAFTSWRVGSAFSLSPTLGSAPIARPLCSLSTQCLPQMLPARRNSP